MSKHTITAEDVAAAFGGTVAFGTGTAGKVASAMEAIDGHDHEGKPVKGLDALGRMHPDTAGRRVAAAVERATRGDGDAEGVRVSIDTCIAALTYITARAGLRGQQVGGGSETQPQAATPQSGTASQAGATSTGAGAAAGGNFGQRMAARRAASKSK